MDRLTQILIETMRGYATEALGGGREYLVCDTESQVYATVYIGQLRDQHEADAGLIAHIENGFIVIDLDMNDKMLVDALIQNGIPRSQIILAYAGERIPDPTAIS